jgi:hypothetical protein
MYVFGIVLKTNKDDFHTHISFVFLTETLFVLCDTGTELCGSVA